MTIDETIAHQRKLADDFREFRKISGAFKEQAKKQIREYEQIAEWLEDYKRLASEKDEMLYEKAIELAIKALEKQMPKKPKEYEDKYYACSCGNVLLMKWEKYNTILTQKSKGLPYCLACGQKIDWGENNDRN